MFDTGRAATTHLQGIRTQGYENTRELLHRSRTHRAAGARQQEGGRCTGCGWIRCCSGRCSCGFWTVRHTSCFRRCCRTRRCCSCHRCSGRQPVEHVRRCRSSQRCGSGSSGGEPIRSYDGRRHGWHGRCVTVHGSSGDAGAACAESGDDATDAGFTE
jgi:hypothetical protein